MKYTILKKEIKSKALSHIVQSLCDTYDRAKSGELKTKDASNEITIFKHTIQTIALDWMYSSKLNSIKEIKQAESEG